MLASRMARKRSLAAEACTPELIAEWKVVERAKKGRELVETSALLEKARVKPQEGYKQSLQTWKRLSDHLMPGMAVDSSVVVRYELLNRSEE